MIAYWAKGVQEEAAKEHPVFQRILYAGPWKWFRHPSGGCLAVWADWPDAGATSSHDPAAYGEPFDCGDGLFYLPPKQLPDLYDLVKDGAAGVEISLACGKVISIPCALSSGVQFGLSKRNAGGMVTEYGRLAHELLLHSRIPSEKDPKGQGVSPTDPRLHRLINLAIGQRYRSTPELLDDLHLVSMEDIEPLLGAIWCGDPKAVGAASNAGEPSASDSSDVKTLS